MLEKTIERATERDPEQRFQSATEMRAALAAALEEPERRRLHRRRIAYVVLGVLGLGILGGASYGAAKPELRARAYSSIKPTLEQLDKLRHRGQPTAVAQAEPAALPAPPPAPGSAAPPAPAEAEATSPGKSSPPVAATDQMDDGETEEGASPDEPKAEQAQADEAKSEEANPDQPKPAGDEKLEKALAAASEAMNEGQRLKAYNQLKQLGKRYGKDPRVLKAWCEAAVATKSWGEAYRVAKRWAEADKNSESLLELARRARSVGKASEAFKTVNLVLKADPQSEEATKFLETLTKGPSRVAQK